MIFFNKTRLLSSKLIALIRSMERRLPKKIVDPDVHRDRVTNSINRFLDIMKWKDKQYYTKLVLQNDQNDQNDNKDQKSSTYVVSEHIIVTEEALVKYLLSTYLLRGRAIWFSCLHMRGEQGDNYGTASYEYNERKKEIYGKNILNYSKCEKMFVGNPRNCMIIFRSFDNEQFYDLDDILNNIENIV